MKSYSISFTAELFLITSAKRRTEWAQMAVGGETFRGDSTVIVYTVTSRVADTPVLRTEVTSPAQTTKKCMEATSAFIEHFMWSQANTFIMFIVLLSLKRTIWTY